MKQFLLILKVTGKLEKGKRAANFHHIGYNNSFHLWSSIDIVNNQTIKAQKRSIELTIRFKPIIIDRELPYVSQVDFVQFIDGWLINPVIANLSNSDTIMALIFRRLQNIL